MNHHETDRCGWFSIFLLLIFASKISRALNLAYFVGAAVELCTSTAAAKFIGFTHNFFFFLIYSTCRAYKNAVVDCHCSLCRYIVSDFIALWLKQACEVEFRVSKMLLIKQRTKTQWSIEYSFILNTNECFHFSIITSEEMQKNREGKKNVSYVKNHFSFCAKITAIFNIWPLCSLNFLYLHIIISAPGKNVTKLSFRHQKNAGNNMQTHTHTFGIIQLEFHKWKKIKRKAKYLNGFTEGNEIICLPYSF